MLQIQTDINSGPDIKILRTRILFSVQLTTAPLVFVNEVCKKIAFYVIDEIVLSFSIYVNSACLLGGCKLESLYYRRTFMFASVI